MASIFSFSKRGGAFGFLRLSELGAASLKIDAFSLEGGRKNHNYCFCNAFIKAMCTNRFYFNFGRDFEFAWDFKRRWWRHLSESVPRAIMNSFCNFSLSLMIVEKIF